MLEESDRHGRCGRPWTAEEDHLLEFYWGAKKLEWIAARLRRSMWGVTSRALKRKLGPFERGTVSMKQFCVTSGFLQHQVLRAARHLNESISRAAPGSPIAPKRRRRYAITEDQQERLLAELLRVTAKSSHVFADRAGDLRSTKGKWGVGQKPPACLRCGTSTRPHCCRGLCASCYNNAYKKRSSPTEQERQPLDVAE